MAVTYGADAVYLGGEQFGMRAAAGNFSPEGLREGVRFAHARGVRVYVTCNTILRNADAAALPAFLELLADVGADAVIAADAGVMAAAKRYAPDLDLHVSTQVGVASWPAARALYDQGAKRVILARELTLDEIAEIRAKTPAALEIETFVHGSMCVSFSGRCLLSEYLMGRDANRGACAQPCRWEYRVLETADSGQLLEIREDGGTYLLNSKDLCMIDHLRELAAAGVDGGKIEGRTKSAYYTAVMTNAYRRAADAAAAGLPPDPVWRNEVNKVSHRPYSTGFYFAPGGPGQHREDAQYQTDCDVVARVESCAADGSARLTQRNRFYAGDELELVTPDRPPVRFIAAGLTDADGNPIDAVPHPMMEFRMRLPFAAPQYAFVRKDRT